MLGAVVFAAQFFIFSSDCFHSNLPVAISDVLTKRHTDARIGAKRFTGNVEKCRPAVCTSLLIYSVEKKCHMEFSIRFAPAHTKWFLQFLTIAGIGPSHFLTTTPFGMKP